MDNNHFCVLYNGHPVEISAIDENTYTAHVSYKPLIIQLQKSADGVEHWIDQETQQETFVSTEIGKLISNHLCVI